MTPLNCTTLKTSCLMQDYWPHDINRAMGLVLCQKFTYFRCHGNKGRSF